MASHNARDSHPNPPKQSTPNPYQRLYDKHVTPEFKRVFRDENSDFGELKRLFSEVESKLDDPADMRKLIPNMPTFPGLSKSVGKKEGYQVFDVENGDASEELYQRALAKAKKRDPITGVELIHDYRDDKVFTHQAKASSDERKWVIGKDEFPGLKIVEQKC